MLRGARLLALVRYHGCADQAEQAEAGERPLRREQQLCGWGGGWCLMHGIPEGKEKARER